MEFILQRTLHVMLNLAIAALQLMLIAVICILISTKELSVIAYLSLIYAGFNILISFIESIKR